MKMVSLMLLSGALSAGIFSNTALAATQSELAALMAERTELPKSKAEAFNRDLETLIKRDTSAGMAVKIKDLGTFKGGVAYEKRTRNPATGKMETMTFYKAPKGKLSTVTDGGVIKEITSTGRYSQTEAQQLLNAYKAETMRQTSRGNPIENAGFGTMSTVAHSAKKYKTPTGQVGVAPAYMAPKFSASSSAPGLRFTADTTYKKIIRGPKK